MATQINPFIYSRAVTPAEFVGREVELRRLFSRLATGQSTAIIGLPHVGKTSLLNFVMDPACRQSQFGAEFDRDVFHVLDAQMLRAVKSQSEFWEQALAPLVERFTGGDSHLQPLRTVCQMAKDNRYGSFVLEELFTAFKKQGLRFMLFLDEFDDLLSHPVLNSAEFYGSLRSLASRSLGLVLVLGSRRDVDELNMLTQKINPHGSPYFNIFTQVTLKTLPDKAFDELLSRAGDRFEPTDRAYIKAVSGQHPFLTQAAAAKIWEAEEEGLKGVKRYEHAGRELYNEAKQHFADTWRVWSNTTRRAVTMVALIQIPTLLGNHAFAIQDNHKALSDYASELEGLEDLGVLAHTPDHWVVTQGGFLWWLADELKRNVRDEADFKSWLQAQEMDGLLTAQQKTQLSQTTSVALGYLGKGATTLIEASAKAAVGVMFK